MTFWLLWGCPGPLGPPSGPQVEKRGKRSPKSEPETLYRAPFWEPLGVISGPGGLSGPIFEVIEVEKEFLVD